MNDFFNYYGKIGLLKDLDFNAYNRAFKYGDGIIETIRVFDSKPIFLENHFARIKKSAAILEFDLKDFKLSSINDSIESLSVKSRVSNGFVRLELFRSGQGSYIPETNKVEYLISITELDSDLFELNREGITTDIFTKYKKAVSEFSFVKSCNSQFYTMAGIYAKKLGLKTCLLLNSKDELMEALFSNLFIVKDKVIYTPELSSGCIEGTMRGQIFKIADILGYRIKEVKVLEQDILNADEVFLTNAVRGIEWVGAFKKRRYFNSISSKMSSELKKLV